MKKAILLIVMCTMLVGLTGCGTKTPAMAADGTPWNKDWLQLGPTIGVENRNMG